MRAAGLYGGSGTMSVRGKLTKAKLATTMPVDAPVYHRKPFHFRRARLLRFDYETDTESAAELVPEQLTLTEPSTAFLLINEYAWSTLGPYREAVLGVNVQHDNQGLHYLTHLMLDAEVPVLAGRDIYGFPKKMGVVEFIQQEDLMAGYVERPRGIRLCSGVLRPEQLVNPLPDGTALPTCALRVIPSPEKDKDHSLVELIQTDMIFSSTELWSGPGSCYFTGASVLDPWHRLPVKRMIAATYMLGDFILPDAEILETL
jgi:acetoacetate decarboxylase